MPTLLTLRIFCSETYQYNASKRTSQPILQTLSSEMHIFLLSHNSPTRARAASFVRFLDRTEWHNTVSRTSLDEGSARLTDLYLTTHNTYKRHPFPLRDSKPQSQQASGRRHTHILNLLIWDFIEIVMQFRAFGSPSADWKWFLSDV